MGNTDSPTPTRPATPPPPPIAPAGINVNCVLAYALVTNGYVAEAEALARDIVRTLADDLRANGQWHECYHADEPAVYLAAPGCVPRGPRRIACQCPPHPCTTWRRLRPSQVCPLCCDHDVLHPHAPRRLPSCPTRPHRPCAASCRGT